MPTVRVCRTCGKEFAASNGIQFYCSAGCRFLSKIDKSGGDDACWIWRGTVDKVTGYGSFGVHHAAGKPHRLVGAHRYSWAHHVGAIPDAKSVLHRCDVRACVNPAHLFLGTHGDNMADGVKKARFQHGRGHHNAKLSESDILTIRRANDAGMPQWRIAKAYDISQSHVSQIIRAFIWKRAGGP